jgi:hypothetical protein
VTDDELIQRLSLLVLDVCELVAERDQLRRHDKVVTDLTIDQQAELGRLATENERLWAALKTHHDLGLWSLGHEVCPECHEPLARDDGA